MKLTGWYVAVMWLGLAICGWFLTGRFVRENVSLRAQVAEYEKAVSPTPSGFIQWGQIAEPEQTFCQHIGNGTIPTWRDGSCYYYGDTESHEYDAWLKAHDLHRQRQTPTPSPTPSMNSINLTPYLITPKPGPFGESFSFHFDESGYTWTIPTHTPFVIFYDGKTTPSFVANYPEIVWLKTRPSPTPILNVSWDSMSILESGQTIVIRQDEELRFYTTGGVGVTRREER